MILRDGASAFGPLKTDQACESSGIGAKPSIVELLIIANLKYQPSSTRKVQHNKYCSLSFTTLKLFLIFVHVYLNSMHHLIIPVFHSNSICHHTIVLSKTASNIHLQYILHSKKNNSASAFSLNFSSITDTLMIYRN